MSAAETPPSDWGNLSASAVRSIKEASREGTRIGTVEGIRDAVADEVLIRSLVDAVIKATRDDLASTSGRWLISGISGLLSRAAWALLIVSGILALGGGWAGVLAFFKTGGGVK
jgi:hypothetical protein